MTTTLPSAAEERAAQAMLDHRAQVLRGLYERVGDLRVTVLGGAGFSSPLAALAAYLATEILPHAAAIYPAAAAEPTVTLPAEPQLPPGVPGDRPFPGIAVIEFVALRPMTGAPNLLPGCRNAASCLIDLTGDVVTDLPTRGLARSEST